jgi:endonuclease/exonuclease/phosphatase family metal-dependent hydrolase
VRVISWNIEKGKRWEQLLACFDQEDLIKADILCLNEVDHGMARSRNKDIAFELANRLGMQYVFGPVYRELTKGIGDERLVVGENEIGIQGNAILTRLPILEQRNILLPVCHDSFHDEEKREGGRSALLVRLDIGRQQSIAVANTHLEVLTTRRCRSRQMRFLLHEVGEGPAILAGDWNTNTFDRGNAWRTFRSIQRLLRPDVTASVLRPFLYEPLFEELGLAGFEWAGFNDEQPTCHADLSSLEDQRFVPSTVRKYILRRIRELPLRLDWIAARGFRPLQPGQTIRKLPAAPSDHFPIMCDVVPN